MKDISKEAIRIGTLVSGNQKDPAGYIRQIIGYGFESFSLTFWQTLGDKNLKKLADDIKQVLDGTGVVISSLAVFGNPLENSDLDKETLKSWSKLIDNAHLFGTDIVAGFTGRLRGKSIPDSMSKFKKIFTPLAKRAKDKGVRIAFENCDMGGHMAERRLEYRSHSAGMGNDF